MSSIPRNFVVNSTDTGVMFNITLTWSRPDPSNGIITQYIVSDINAIIFDNTYCHRYFILVQTHKVKLLMISLFRQQTSTVTMTHPIHGLT